jgi:hypothetical protein
MKAENIYNGLTKEGCRFSFWIPTTDPASAANTTGSNNTQNAQVMA